MPRRVFGLGGGMRRLGGSAIDMPNPIAGGTSYQQKVGQPSIQPQQGIAPGQSKPMPNQAVQQNPQQPGIPTPPPSAAPTGGQGGIIANPFGPPGVETGGGGPVVLGRATGGGPLHNMQPSVPDVQNAPRGYSPAQEAQQQQGNPFLTRGALPTQNPRASRMSQLRQRLRQRFGRRAPQRNQPQFDLGNALRGIRRRFRGQTGVR